LDIISEHLLTIFVQAVIFAPNRSFRAA
jgi:hypothetical protein